MPRLEKSPDLDIEAYKYELNIRVEEHEDHIRLIHEPNHAYESYAIGDAPPRLRVLFDNGWHVMSTSRVPFIMNFFLCIPKRVAMRWSGQLPEDQYIPQDAYVRLCVVEHTL